MVSSYVIVNICIFTLWSVAEKMMFRVLIIRWSTLRFSLSLTLSALHLFSLCLNRITRLSRCACRLCLRCHYPLASSHFDKLGHENKPPRCQQNAKYRASFLWLCLFNQLPLISALHPLFLSFQNVMEEKSVYRRRLLRSTLLLHPRSARSSFHRCFHLSPSITLILLPALCVNCSAAYNSVQFPYSHLSLSFRASLFSSRVVGNL